MSPLILIPARNEAMSLPAVVAAVRSSCPSAEILVVDDASDDGTAVLLPRLAVRWIRIHERLGVGGAVRCGLRYARRLGYRAVVRLDGDGQHPPQHIARLVAALERQGCDAAVGSRYTDGDSYETPPGRRVAQRALSALLSSAIGSAVTDPTSGFWAFGQRAIELLCEEHPDGFSEPLLRLVLHRNGLRVAEVPVPMQRRQAGRTSLRPLPMGLTLARILVELTVGPVREAFLDAPPEATPGARSGPASEPAARDGEATRR